MLVVEKGGRTMLPQIGIMQALYRPVRQLSRRRQMKPPRLPLTALIWSLVRCVVIACEAHAVTCFATTVALVVDSRGNDGRIIIQSATDTRQER